MHSMSKENAAEDNSSLEPLYAIRTTVHDQSASCNLLKVKSIGR